MLCFYHGFEMNVNGESVSVLSRYVAIYSDTDDHYFHESVQSSFQAPPLVRSFSPVNLNTPLSSS
jgi:hypothetical protein